MTPNPYDRLNTSDFKALAAEAQERSFETSVVDYMLKAFNMSAYRKQMKELHDFEYLSFSAFEQVCRFPFKLWTNGLTDLKPIYRDSKSVHPLWFKSFRKIPFVMLFEQRLEELLEEDSGFSAFGMIFPRKGFRNGMIIHTGHWEEYVGYSSGCHVYKGKEDLGINYVVQPYQAFITNIAKQNLWSPED